MNNFYQDMQGVASDLLREFDQGNTYYVAVTPGNGPPDNPGEPTELLHKLNAVVRGVSFRYVDGTNVVASDLQLTMAVLPNVEPSITGFVLCDGVRYKVVRVIRKPAAGTVAAWTLIFRK